MTDILTEELNNKILTLIRAVEQDDVEKVTQVTNNGLFTDVLNGIPINEIGIQQFTALHVAIRNDNITMVQKLLSMGANANIGSDARIYYPHFDMTFGVTPLYIAIYTENAEAVKLLLLSGANANHYIKHYPFDVIDTRETRYQLHPLSFALSLASYHLEKMSAIIDHILSSGQELDDIYKTLSYSPLISCIDRGFYSLTRLLLEKYVHANPNEIEVDGEGSRDFNERRSALMVAIEHSPETEDVILDLLRYGANPNNNIGFEYSIMDVLHPDMVNDYERQSENFDTAKEVLLPEIEFFVTQYNNDPEYKSMTLINALDYAYLTRATNNIIYTLISNGAVSTTNILHHEGRIFANNSTTNFDNTNPDHIQKIRNIPKITPEEYENCIVSMGSEGTLSDFITAEETPIENTVILPSVNKNSKTCMDRNSFGKYFVSRMNSNQPLSHPFTRENIMQAPKYKEWKETNYPFGMEIDYNKHRSPENQTRKGGKRGKKHTKKRSMRGKGNENSQILSDINMYNEIRKDAIVVRKNMKILMQSRVIFDQYHRKLMEEIPEKVQQRMSKYSSLVVPMVDFLTDIHTLQNIGGHKEFPIDIVMLHTEVIEIFQEYPFLVTIGVRSPVEGYDFMTKIQDMERTIQTKSGGRKKKYKSTKKRKKKKREKTKRNGKR